MLMILKIDPQREMACASLEPLQKSGDGLPKVYQDHDDHDVVIFRCDDEKKIDSNAINGTPDWRQRTRE